MNFKLILNVSTILLSLNTGFVSANTGLKFTETKRVITTNLGQVLVDEDGARYVFFGKDIDAVWAVDADNNVIDTAWVTKTDVGYTLRWAGDTLQEYNGREFPVFTVTDEVPELIHKYSSVIGNPLIAEVGPLPKGAVFNSFWFVVVGEDQAHWQWRSFGEYVVVTSPEGEETAININLLLDNVNKGKLQ